MSPLRSQRAAAEHRGARGRRWTARSRRNQLLISAICGITGGIVLQFFVQWPVVALLGWDMACVVFLARTWISLGSLGSEDVEPLATREDTSRAGADLILVLTSVICIVGVGFMLIEAARARGDAVAGLLATAVVSLVASWFVVHTVFTLRYARLYYSGERRGVDFHQDDPPDYFDFAYLAFTIGMTFQVSDTDISDSTVRKTALRQALISYLFGAVLLAMTVNVGASLLK